MNSDALGVFDLTQEPDNIREAYGAGRFGQGCLLARRLIEQGVPFVEVTLGNPADGTVGWDTHADVFKSVKSLCGELDAGWSMLLKELQERGLLESTTIVWMGEFGRTPKINEMGGRDHFPNAWTCVLGGGGIRGGQVVGKTSPDGMEVIENKVGVEDLLATVCAALGVDPETENEGEDGRPIKISDGTPISGLI
jgi:arylsulfatase A-like enzyme